MRSAPLGCALLVSLVGTATALSAVRFTGRDGSVKLISYDGNKLNVPGYCEATTCTTNARGIGANEKAIEALEAAVLCTCTCSGTLNHDSYVYGDKYFGEAYTSRCRSTSVGSSKCPHVS